MAWKLCPECAQPLLPKGRKKKPNEFDHASGCPHKGKGEADFKKGRLRSYKDFRS